MDAISQAAMVGSIEMNSTTSFNGLEGVGIVKGDEFFGNTIRALGRQPEMKKKVAGVRAPPQVHPMSPQRVGSTAASEPKSNLMWHRRAAVVDGNQHGRKSPRRGGLGMRVEKDLTS
jgi:hypothetical protein